MLQITPEKREEIREKFSKYEIARILGARALQISMNAPILFKFDAKELEEINYDPLRIAEYEFFEGILPITVKRPLPRKGKDKIIIEKPTAEKKKEEDTVKKEALEKTAVSEKEIIEEVKDTEVMELAQPEDEEDSTEEAKEEI